MSRWQQISRRHYHYHREPENEPDPLFIYYSTHLKGNKQLSASVMEVCLLRARDLFRCSIRMCLHITKAELPGNLLIYVELCQLFAQTTLKSQKRGQVSQRSCSLRPSGQPPALFDVHFSHLSWTTESPRQKTVLDDPISTDRFHICI